MVGARSSPRPTPAFGVRSDALVASECVTAPELSPVPVPGTRITDRQVCLYMNIRRNKSQTLAAATAGISERSARRIEVAVELPSQRPRRYRKSRCQSLPFACLDFPTLRYRQVCCGDSLRSDSVSAAFQTSRCRCASTIG